MYIAKINHKSLILERYFSKSRINEDFYQDQSDWDSPPKKPNNRGDLCGEIYFNLKYSISHERNKEFWKLIRLRLMGI